MKAKKPAKKAGQNRTPKKEKAPVWIKAFLAALSQTGNISRACRESKVGHSTVYDLCEKSEEFKAAFQDALIEASDLLEEEALRRAKDGLIRFKFHQGEAIIDPRTGEPYYELEYSDTLLIFLMKAGNPAKYREHYEHHHTGDAPVQVAEVIVRTRAEASAILSALSPAR